MIDRDRSSEFLDEVPDAGEPIGLKVMRVPPKGKIGGVCLSNRPVIRGVHFWGGRTIPHTRENCEPCKVAVELRYKAWLSLYSLKTAQVAVVELTPPALRPLQERLKSHGTLRGCNIVVARLGVRPNGTLFTTVTTAAVAPDVLPVEPDLPYILEKMWGIAATFDAMPNLKIVE